MFFTSTGFAIGTHECQGNIKSFNLFGKAKNCYELIGKGEQKSCSHHKTSLKSNTKKSTTAQYQKKSCCNDKMVYAQSDVDQQFQQINLDLNLSTPLFITAFVAGFNNFYKQSINSLIGRLVNDRTVPLFSRDIYVLTQTFLL